MLVSVIIPCYNVEKYIEECIESVVSQTYKNIQIVCVDNNSNDKTWDILCQLKEKYPLELAKEIKAGASAARNKGLSVAQGEWIQFLDADDLLLPNKIEHQVILIQNKNIAFVASAYKKRNLYGNETEISLLDENIFISTFTNQCGITSANFWNKDAIRKIGCWNENLKSSQESDLMMRLALNNNQFLIDKTPLAIIRERETGQISQRNPAEKWKQYIDVRLYFLKELEKKSPDIYQKNQKIYIDYLLISLITLSRYNKSEAINIYNTCIKSGHKFNFTNLHSGFIKLFGLKHYLILKPI